MRMAFDFVEEPEWPPLAWLAECSPAASAVRVRHGSRVEVRPDWFGEIIWDGEFASADFDRTDTVFGSGGRLRDGGVTFVASATTMDRLHSATHRQCSYVSNSLACLCAAEGASVDRTYNRYVQDFKTIIRGLEEYRREVVTTIGDVHLTYYRNLLWNGRTLSTAAKPLVERRFPVYEDYCAFLSDAVRLLSANARSNERVHRWSLAGTISSGYDSAATACIAREHGLTHVVSISRARDGRRDSGEEIAAVLGLDCTVVDTDAWRAGTLPEVPFIAADGKGGEVFLAGAGSMLSNAVVFMGTVGDVVWGKNLPVKPDNVLARKDQSGLSLAEYRLWTGFIALCVPTIGIQQRVDIDVISRSAEMAPWDVEGTYSRPIPRRILETAGVPRGAFGVEKKAGAIRLTQRTSFLSEASMTDYLEWLRTHRSEWIRRRRLPPDIKATLRSPLQDAVTGVTAIIDRKASSRLGQRTFVRTLRSYGNAQELVVHLFPWALEHAVRAYPRCSAAAGAPHPGMYTPPAPLTTGP